MSGQWARGGLPRRRRVVIVAGVALAVSGVAVAFVALRGGGHERGAVAPPGPGARPAANLPTLLVLPKRRSATPGNRGQRANSAGSALRAEYEPGRLLVKFEDGTSAGATRAVLRRAGAELDGRVGKIGVGVVGVDAGQTPEALAALKASPAVAYVERDRVVSQFATQPSDPYWLDQWGLQLVRAPQAWDSARGSPSVVIAVLDSGVDPTHPDLSGALVGGYDFAAGDGDPTDDNGHGTAVAGVIAARTSNAEGGAGMCWKCSVMPVKVLDAEGRGTDSALAAGIVWAVDHGARVLNMSLGGYGTTQTLADAVSYAQSKGAVLVAAAGNDGASTTSYPAGYPGVIGVAGSTQSDALYRWSNFGDWVSVAAPGCDIAPYLDGEYVNFCGTSAATPLVAGLVGLVLSAKPDATPDEVAQAVRAGAVPLDGGGARYGRIDTYTALETVGARPAPAPAQPPPPVTRLDAVSFHGALTRQTPLMRYRQAVGAGSLTVELESTRAPAPTLIVADAAGRTIARAAGRRTIRLTRSVPAGTYEFRVSGARGVPYTLDLSFIRP